MKNKFYQLRDRFRNKKYTIWIMVGVFILLQLLVAAFYMNKKQIYFIDELFCYEGAHNVMLYPFSSNGFPYRLDHNLDSYYKWITKDDIMPHFEVRGEEKLSAHSFSDIKQNIKTKNVYYIMLNLVLSFWPDPAFTKWSGYLLNAIIFILHQIVLYFIGLEVFKDKKKAMLPMIIYGFSAGGITLVIFIRFYLLKSLLCMLITYSHMLLFRKKRVVNIVMAFAITALATLCLYANQPYIVIYAASAVFVFCIACLLKKEYKLLLKYVGIGLAGAAVILVFMPNVLSSLLRMAQSSYGIEAIDNFSNKPLKEYAHYIVFYFMKTLSHVTAGVYGLAAGILLLIIVWLMQGEKKFRFFRPNYCSLQVLYILGVSICYFLINTRIQYSEEYRYMSCIYAELSVGIAVLLEWVIDCFDIHYRSAVLSTVVLLGLIISYRKGYVDEIYPEITAAKQCLEEYEGVANLFIKPKDSVVRYYQDGFVAVNENRLYLMEPSDMESADYSFLDDMNEEGIVCWIPVTWETEDAEQRDWVLAQVLVHTKYKEYDKLFETVDTYGSSVYYIH